MPPPITGRGRKKLEGEERINKNVAVPLEPHFRDRRGNPTAYDFL